ncbi:MAG TPA: VOC family protein [Flavobacteriaceae bacterium]|nr:VOC family protein [Flavobacteriaceae bacterium]
MTKIDPIIAVKDVNASSKWYQSVFGCNRTHGGDEFAVLEDENHEIIICLHKWGEHGHPTMTNPKIKPGNGLILYYKTDNLETIRLNLEKMNHPIEAEIHLNSNSRKKEFSVCDPDGYYLTITEYHNYEG